MTKKSQKINLSANQTYKKKVATYKKSMPVIKCACGFEILVLPDSKAMNNAIKNHIAKHKKARYGSERLTEFLTEQVLIVASQMNLQL